VLHFPTWKKLLVYLICTVGVIFTLPNLLPANFVRGAPNWLPLHRVNLGLDLRGGSYLLYQVEMKPLIHDELENLADALRPRLLGDGIGYSGGLSVIDGHVAIKLRDASRLDDTRADIKKLASGLLIKVYKGDQVTFAFPRSAVVAQRFDAVERSIEIIRRRIDASGVREPVIEREGDDRIVVELPGVGDPVHLQRLIGKTAKLTFQLVDARISAEDALQGRLPPGDEVLPAGTGARQAPQEYVVRRGVVVDGDMLTDAEATFQNNEPVVSFSFDSLGARRFADATSANVGSMLAIVLDNKVISAPVIREPISDGKGIISGNFSLQSANDLALLLRAGALPAPLRVLEERTVGPGLGADSIREGGISCLVGVTLVALFMATYYGLFGVFADIALFFNLCLIVAGLTILDATLTLPGIAGVALTLGMAVDANVLIYERIREELRAGRTMVSSLDAGFRRAFGTILDSHVTTLVAGGLLFWFGSGPVKGFAVTLTVGVITSLFTALLVTRLQIVDWFRRTRPRAFPI